MAKLKQSNPAEFQDNLEAFMETLTVEQAFEICSYLKLADWCYLSQEEIRSKGCSIDKDVCTRLLQAFAVDPKAFRQRNDSSHGKFNRKLKSESV